MDKNSNLDTDVSATKTPAWSKLKLKLKLKWLNNILWLLGFLAIYLTLRSFMQGDVIAKVPQLQLYTITNKSINLAQINQPMLVQFWATWCSICKLEKDSIEDIAKDYLVVNIATQSGNTRDLIKYAKQNQINPENVVNDSDGHLMKLFGAKAVPASFIVDKQGVVVTTEVGYSTELGLRFRLWLASL